MNVGLYPLLILISQLIVAIFLMIFLILIDTILTLGVALILGGAYAIIYKVSKNFIKIGDERLMANEKRFNSLNEAFGAVKQLKVSGLEEIYFQRFKIPAISFAKSNAWLVIVSQLPRYALEAIAFGGMILVILYLIALKGAFLGAVPVIALYTFAGYRLMPALQRIYQSYAEVRFSLPAINSLYEM